MLALFTALVIQASDLSPSQISSALPMVPGIRSGFDETLLDYPSARFRDVHLTVNLETEEPRKAYFCGYVNSKNRMGAYVGWRHFSASFGLDAFIMIDDGENETAAFIVSAACGAGGQHAIDPVDRSALLTFR